MAFSYDRVGLLLGDPTAPVRRALVTLDVSDDAIEACLALECQVLIAHHPLIWDPLPRLIADDVNQRRILRLAGSGVAVIAAHTNWDTALGGVNDVLAHLLGLRKISGFGSVPSEAEPETRIGRVGRITAEPLREFVARVDQSLGTRAMAWGDPTRRIETVAVIGGSGDDEWPLAKAAGADVLVTGEVRHHVSRDAVDAGFALIAAGHFATENPGMAAMTLALRSQATGIEWHAFTPVPGRGGHPWYA